MLAGTPGQAETGVARRGERWSGSVGMILARCFHQGAPPAPDQTAAPCSPDLDTDQVPRPGDVAVGIDASAAYQATRRLSLGVEALYEPDVRAFEATALAVYSVPLLRDAALEHSAALTMPFAIGHKPFDPLTLTLAETLELTPSRWQIALSLFGQASYGSNEGLLTQTPPVAAIAPLGATTASRTIVERQLGALASGEALLTKHWSLLASIDGVAHRDIESPSLNDEIEATPLAVRLYYGSWIHELSYNVAGNLAEGEARTTMSSRMSSSVEFASHWEF